MDYFCVLCGLADHRLYHSAAVWPGQAWNEVAWFEQAVDIALFVRHAELLVALDVVYRMKGVCI